MSPRELPILFSAPMVRALLSGAKTQTRRAVKFDARPAAPHLPDWPSIKGISYNPDFSRPSVQRLLAEVCPYGSHGDLLWVRETHMIEWPEADRPEDEAEFRRWVKVHYAATEAKPDLVDAQTDRPMGWTPSIFLRKEHCRLWLRVADVRVERLQDISEADAIAEGVRRTPGGLGYGVEVAPGTFDHIRSSPVDSFRSLWESINGHESWGSQWVWVVSFARADR